MLIYKSAAKVLLFLQDIVHKIKMPHENTFDLSMFNKINLQKGQRKGVSNEANTLPIL